MDPEAIQENFESDMYQTKRPSLPVRGKGAERLRIYETEKAEQAIQKHVHFLESDQNPKTRQEKLGKYWGWVNECMRMRYLPQTEIEDFEISQTENTVTVLHKPSQLSSTFSGAKDQHENEKGAYERIWGILEDHRDAWKHRVSKKFKARHKVIS